MDDVWRKSAVIANPPISAAEAQQMRDDTSPQLMVPNANTEVEMSSPVIRQDSASDDQKNIRPPRPPSPEAPRLEEVFFEEEEASDDEVPWHWEYNNPKLGFVYWVISSYKPRKASDDEFYLRDCEGELKPGEICCILSPKDSATRFINLISGRTGKADFYGEIVVGGAPKTAPIMKAGTSYLLDGQVLPNYLTVEECLLYTTYFVTNPEDEALEDHQSKRALRQSKVDSIVKNLGIESIRSTRVRGICGSQGISPAQRVLVNIGRMLLDGKTIVFLDNPTKGLDLIDEETVITTIFDVTKKQKLTVFLSMEHPTKNLLDNFNKLLVLAKGQQLYYGKTQKITEFFRRLGNPLPDETSIYDHLLDIIHNAQDEKDGASESEESLDEEQQAQGHLDEVVRKSKAIFDSERMSHKSPEERKMREEVLKHMQKQTEFLKAGGDSITKFYASWCFQTTTLIRRNMQKIVRDPSALILKFFPIAIFLALFGFWFRNVAKKSVSVDSPETLAPQLRGSFIDLPSHDTLTGILISLVGVQLVSLREVHDAIQEAALFKSDSRANHYSQSAYVAAWTVNALLDQAILIIPYSLATFSFLGMYKGETWMEHSDDWVTWAYFMGIHVVLSTICEIFVNIFAFLTQSSYETLQWAVVSNCFFTLFAGFVRRYPSTTEFYFILSYLSPIKHAYEGIVIEFMEGGAEFDNLDLVSSAYGMDREPFAQSKYVSWIALGGYLVFCYMVFVVICGRV